MSNIGRLSTFESKDFYTKAEVDAMLPKMDCLYTRELTTDNNCTAATVSVPNLDQYDWCLLYYRNRFNVIKTTPYNSTGYDGFRTQILPVDNGVWHAVECGVYQSGYHFLRYFQLNPSNNTMAWSTAYWMNNATYSSGSDVIIPYKLYGIKNLSGIF